MIGGFDLGVVLPRSGQQAMRWPPPFWCFLRRGTHTANLFVLVEQRGGGHRRGHPAFGGALVAAGAAAGAIGGGADPALRLAVVLFLECRRSRRRGRAQVGRRARDIARRRPGSPGMSPGPGPAAGRSRPERRDWTPWRLTRCRSGGEEPPGAGWVPICPERIRLSMFFPGHPLFGALSLAFGGAGSWAGRRRLAGATARLGCAPREARDGAARGRLAAPAFGRTARRRSGGPVPRVGKATAPVRWTGGGFPPKTCSRSASKVGRPQIRRRRLLMAGAGG